jgi:hypothetical protein
LEGARAAVASRCFRTSSDSFTAIERPDTLTCSAVLGTTMQIVLQYERHAAECRQIAAETKNSRYKKQLEDMAEVWERLAAARRQGIIENERDSGQDFQR